MTTTDSLTVGLAVGIPSAVIVFVLLFIYWKSYRNIKSKEDTSDKLNNIDLEADLTFDNYQQLAGPQSPMVEKPAEFNSTQETLNSSNTPPPPPSTQTRTKSKRYRTYSYHPNLKAINNQNAGSRIEYITDNKESKAITTTPETHYSSSTNVTNGNGDNNLISSTNYNSNGTNINNSNVNLTKKDSENLLQNYFEGVIPVVPTKNASELPSSRNSSIANLPGHAAGASETVAPLAEPQVPAATDAGSSHSAIGETNNNNTTAPIAGKPSLASCSRSFFKRSKSSSFSSKPNITSNDSSNSSGGANPPVPPASTTFTSHNNHTHNQNHHNIASDNSTDSLNQQYFMKSLNKNVMESNDFTMPIPGSNRNSVLFDKRGSSTDLNNLHLGRPVNSNSNSNFTGLGTATNNNNNSHPKLATLARQQLQQNQHHQIKKSSSKLSNELKSEQLPSPLVPLGPTVAGNQQSSKSFYLQSETSSDAISANSVGGVKSTTNNTMHSTAATTSRHHHQQQQLQNGDDTLAVDEEQQVKGSKKSKRSDSETTNTNSDESDNNPFDSASVAGSNL